MSEEVITTAQWDEWCSGPICDLEDTISVCKPVKHQRFIIMSCDYDHHYPPTDYNDELKPRAWDDDGNPFAWWSDACQEALEAHPEIKQGFYDLMPVMQTKTIIIKCAADAVEQQLEPVIKDKQVSQQYGPTKKRGKGKFKKYY